MQSSVCVVDGVLLAIGGEDQDGSHTSSIYGLHLDEKKWRHVGNLPFACSWVDTLLLSGGGLLMVDGDTQQVLKITVQGLAKLFPIGKEADQSQKEADERYLTGELMSSFIAHVLTLYEEAMTKGYVETSVTKCLILGAAGVGKTHLKHLLLKKDPPQQRVSTGLADNPVRAISFSLAGVSVQEEDDWFVVEDDQALLKVVGGTIRDGGVSMATSLDKVVGSFPKMAIHVSSDGAGALHPDPTPAWCPCYHGYQPSEQDCIHRGGADSSHQPLLSGSSSLTVDGQLQYHDILPLFFQNPGVAIFVLNLSEELSHHPAIEYYGADGKPDARPLIITVGTHRDAADKCSESIKEKNLRLKALLDAGSFRILCNGERLKEVIFAVNGKTPQDEDRHVSKVLRKKIASMCPQAIKLPIAWFGLEVLLQRSSHDGILSLVECQVCAQSLHIEGDAFSAALHHLVHYNVFLHYPEILPQTVFCDPQVVLTKVTELVEYHHKLLHSPDEGVAAESDLVTFRDHGLLSVELLSKFPKHYTEGLFTPEDLLKLLVSVRAIAMTSEGGEFLMPALLPHLDSGHVSKYQSTSGIKSACGILKYQAVVVSAKKWKCSSRGHQSGDLSEGQLMWFGESGVRRQDPSTSDPVSLDSEPLLQHLMDKVAAVIPHKYVLIGLQLRLSLAELQVIGPRHPTLEEHHRAFGEMFGVWRRRGSVPYTWRTLIDLLKSASVGEVRLSDELTSWITQ
eukprot:Em0095g9a